MRLELDEEDWKALEVVYSGCDSMASAEDFIDHQWKRASDTIVAAYEIRHSFSVSGAMRWPWSQEAPMAMEFRVSGP